MKTYKHIFFDLDHTLWDFNTNCYHTLDDLYQKYDFRKLGFSKEAFYTTYLGVNNKLWDDLHKGLTDKQTIREKRFQFTFEILGIDHKHIPPGMDNEFIQICPAKGFVFPFTIETLNYLQEKNYSMHIVTNGFRETQSVKIATSGLDPYFTHIIEADVCGFLKPDPSIFMHALELAGCQAEEAIMIGDDLRADVLGAKNVGIDQVYINRQRLPHDENITYEVACLSELKKLF